MGMQQDQLLMHKLIERGAIVAPNEEVVTATADGVRRQTYRETRARSHQLAHALANAGIDIGDRVGTFMWNGSRHLEAYWASAGMGCVLHTINIRLGAKDLAYIINHAGAEIIIVDADRPTANHGTPPSLLFCELKAVGYRLTGYEERPDIGAYIARFAPQGDRPEPSAITPCAAPETAPEPAPEPAKR